VITEGGILDALSTRFPGSLEVVPAVDQPTIRAPKEMLLALMEWLRHDQGYELLLDVCGVDWFPARPRFEVVYHVYNPTRPERLRVKTLVGQNEEIESVTGIWPGARLVEKEDGDEGPLPWMLTACDVALEPPVVDRATGPQPATKTAASTNMADLTMLIQGASFLFGRVTSDGITNSPWSTSYRRPSSSAPHRYPLPTRLPASGNQDT
jgi:NADH-quinone oxidoreductase subunit C